MELVYSATEARARFSEVLQHVLEGQTVTITWRGDSVAEIRPLRPPRTRSGRRSLEDRFAELERKGALTPAPSHREPMKPGPRVPGALARFLAER